MGIGNWVKRSVLVGLGVLGLTKKKADSTLQELGKQTMMVEKEGHDVAKQLVKKTKIQGEKIQVAMNQEFDRMIGGKERRRKSRKRKK